MWAGICTSVWLCLWRPQLAWQGVSPSFIVYFVLWDSISHRAWKSWAVWVDWPVPPRICLPCPTPCASIIDGHCYSWLLCGFWDSKLRSSHLNFTMTQATSKKKKHFPHIAVTPALSSPSLSGYLSQLHDSSRFHRVLSDIASVIIRVHTENQVVDIAHSCLITTVDKTFPERHNKCWRWQICWPGLTIMPLF